MHAFQHGYSDITEVVNGRQIRCAAPPCDTAYLLDDPPLERHRHSQEQCVEGGEIDTFSCDLIDRDQDEGLACSVQRAQAFAYCPSLGARQAAVEADHRNRCASFGSGRECREMVEPVRKYK